MKFSIRISLICFCWGILCQPVITSAQVTIREFLKSAVDDPELRSYDARLEYLKKKPYQLSPLQKLEFRTKNNQLDPDRQDFALRLNPANPWEIKSNRNYFEGYQSLLTLERDFAWKEALLQRYLLIIELLYDTEMKILIEEDQKLTESLIAIMDKQQYSDFFDGEDFIKLKLRQMDQMAEWEETSFEISNQVSKIVAHYPNASQRTVAWTYNQVISIKQLEKVVDSLARLDEASATEQYHQQMITQANQEYKLEKSNINLGFLQTEYEPYRTEQDRTPWSISLGVTIPVVNPNKGDMTKKKLEVIEAEHELEETKAELTAEKKILHDEIKSLINRHQALAAKVEELKAGGFSKTLATMKDSNPAAMVQFNSNIMKLSVIMLKLKENIMLKYIEFLESTDRLQHRPLVNYLSASLEEIQ